MQWSMHAIFNINIIFLILENDHQLLSCQTICVTYSSAWRLYISGSPYWNNWYNQCDYQALPQVTSMTSLIGRFLSHRLLSSHGLLTMWAFPCRPYRSRTGYASILLAMFSYRLTVPVMNALIVVFVWSVPAGAEWQKLSSTLVSPQAQRWKVTNQIPTNRWPGNRGGQKSEPEQECHILARVQVRHDSPGV